MTEFKRRAERLRLTAILARSGPVGSTKELTLGEAGRDGLGDVG